MKNGNSKRNKAKHNVFFNILKAFLFDWTCVCMDMLMFSGVVRSGPDEAKFRHKRSPKRLND